MDSESTSQAITVDKGLKFKVLLGTAVAAIVIVCFYGLFWNKFLGYHAGGGQVAAFAWMCSKGMLPHKDFFLGVPCLNLVKDGWLLLLFQHHYIGLRAFGVFQRVVLALCMFWWYGRIFRPGSALIGALVTVIAGFSDLADYIFVYNDEVLLYSVVSGLIASYVLDQKQVRKTAMLAALSGFFAGLALMTKQTNGLGAVLIVPIVTVPCIWKLDGRARALAALGGFSAGLGLIFSLFLGWMGVNGIIPDFLQQTLVMGPAAKASRAMDFLTRALNQAIYVRSWALVGTLVVLALTGKALLAAGKGRTAETESYWRYLVIAVASLISIAIGAYYGYDFSLTSQVISTITLLMIILAMYYTYAATFLLSLRAAFLWLKSQLTPRQAQVFLCVAMGFTQATMSSLSAPFIPGELVPGIGFLTAALLDSQGVILRSILFVCYTLTIIGVAIFKLHCPYIFEDFSEPPAAEANTACNLEEMKGFLLPKNMAALVDEGVALIKANTKDGDSIYCYPEGSWFYALTERRPPTFSMSHNIDTTSDKMATEDSHKLLAARPKILVFYRTPEPVLTAMEQMWRGGKRSGNRDIIAVCETLASQYKLLKTFDFPDAAPGGIKVMIYLRPDGEGPTVPPSQTPQQPSIPDPCDPKNAKP